MGDGGQRELGQWRVREAVLPTVNGGGGFDVQCSDLGHEKAQDALL